MSSGPHTSMVAATDYRTALRFGCHWSLRLRRGTTLTLRDTTGGANVGMLLYNPECLLERYNAPDTLKAQHTFRIGQGHCLYSDMGRVFASVIHDTENWHDTVCGNGRAEDITARVGARNYQTDRNDWHQNGHDAFLVELTKHGLGLADLAANLNWFSRVEPDADGGLTLVPARADRASPAEVVLRFELDTLVLLHTCPHPLHPLDAWPRGQVEIEIGRAAPLGARDPCRDRCEENRRGFENNALYLLGAPLPPTPMDVPEHAR